MAGPYDKKPYPAGDLLPDDVSQLVVRYIANRYRISTVHEKSGDWNDWGWGMYANEPELEQAVRKRFPLSAEALLRAMKDSRVRLDEEWVRVIDYVAHDEEVWGVSVNERGEVV